MSSEHQKSLRQIITMKPVNNIRTGTPEEIRQQWINDYIKLYKIHEALGLSENDYAASIPKIPKHLEEPINGLPHLLLVERASIETMLAITKIESYKGVEYLPSSDRDIPLNIPYWIRFQDGQKYNGKKPSEAKKEIPPWEWEMHAIQGICALAMIPDLYKQYQCTMLLGTRIKNIPGNCAWVRNIKDFKNRTPTLGHSSSDYPHNTYGLGTYFRTF